jgi:ATP-dependent RNA helicase DeaD
MMFDQAGIDAVWAAAPQAEEIRKLDQQRMLQDTLFTEPATEEDLTLARAMLAERSAEDIAATLAKLYRSRLPSPEDIIDAGSDRGRSRDDRGERGRNERVRGDDRAAAPDTRVRRTEFQNSVWFRIGAGRKRNAEARWLLPMICRRGGVTKKDIGAIRIYGDHSEFEISAEAAEKFSASIKRPDKEENTRIEALPGGPQGEGAAPMSAAPQSSAPKPASPMFASPQPAEHQTSAPSPDRGPREHHDLKKKPDYAKKRDFHGKKQHRHEGKTAFGKPAHGKPAFGKSSHGGPPRREGGAPFKPAFGKKHKTGKIHG